MTLREEEEPDEDHEGPPQLGLLRFSSSSELVTVLVGHTVCAYADRDDRSAGMASGPTGNHRCRRTAPALVRTVAHISPPLLPVWHSCWGHTDDTVPTRLSGILPRAITVRSQRVSDQVISIVPRLISV